MKKIHLYQWWSAGRGDGDGRPEEMEVNDEQYKILSKYDGCDLLEVSDPLVKDLCEKTYDELLKILVDDSSCEWDYVKEEYEILPEDDEEFWDYSDEDCESDLKYTFSIVVEQGDSFVDYQLTRKEKELIYKAIDNGEEFSEVEELSDLFNRVNEAAKDKLQEDLELTGDEEEIDVDELEYAVYFGELPKYKPRYTTTFEDYFYETYNTGIRIEHDFSDIEEN